MCQLAPEETRQLARLVEAGKIAYPDRLFVSFEFFNSYLEDLGPAAGGPLSDSDIQALRIIRNKIFFGERTKMPPVRSTRDLKANQWLHLRRLSTGRVYMAPVVEAGATGLLVVTPSVEKKYLELEPGEKFEIYFWRDRDASYNLESEVIGQSGGRLLITVFRHVDDIERTQRRQYHRVETSIPVAAIPVSRDELEKVGKDVNPKGRGLGGLAQADQTVITGYVINLSGAGFALAARLPLQPNDLVFVELPSEDDGSLPLIAKILGASRRETTGEFIMNAEFVGMSADTRERIFRVIYSQAKHKLPA
jgi:c-di-GMP-binding flagellar brake protein YcgR